MWPSAAAVRGLEQALDAVRGDSPKWLRWQPAERWHVTLLFLGARTDRQADRAAVMAAELAAGTMATPLAIDGFGRFGAILWAGVGRADWMAPLQRQLAHRLQPADRRERFRPHVTVARARQHRVDRSILDRLGAYTGPDWTPADLTLVASVTGPHPRYEIIGRFPFAPSATPA